VTRAGVEAVVATDHYSGRDNSLNFLRLVLASSVILSHAWPLSGLKGDPVFGGMTLGSWAVAGFFAISGFLIAGSRVRLSALEFAWRRLLRLMPAFWVCLVLIAFVMAPFSVWLGAGQWTVGAAMDYVADNFFLKINAQGITGTLTDVPFPDAWNGSLWTLFYEAAAYVVIGLALSLGWARRHDRLTCVVLLVAATAVSAGRGWIDTLGAPGHIVAFGVWLAPFFVAGCLVWSLRATLRPTWAGVLTATAALAVLTAIGNGELTKLLAPIPLAIALLMLGQLLPVRIGSTNDVSYGVYIS
jgi:peptidoglycan/LPS O-acetylase OafA/YrhL